MLAQRAGGAELLLAALIMSETHHNPAPITGYGKNTWALWAVRPADTLVVFIHGYGGKSVETWFQFDWLLPSHSPKTDIVFYGYEGLLHHIQPSATLFYKFLDGCLADPRSFVQGIDLGGERPRPWSYKRIVLVAHSLGAVVSRQALLFALDDGKAWPSRTRLVLFAPAHVGVDKAVRLVLGIRDPLAAAAALSKGLIVASSALRDLLNKKTFKRLREETERWLKKAPRKSQCLIARQVVFGAAENIVKQERFCQDPRPTYISGKNHLSICKPSKAFKAPVSIVAKEL
jgi:pimeloyl-ACP methyl ester carboxylesterase